VSSNLKYEAAKALKTHLVTAAPSVSGRVHEERRSPNRQTQRPELVVEVGSFRPIFREPEEVYDPGAGQNYVLYDVGAFEGTITVRVAAKYAAKREAIEQEVLDAFFADVERPGVLLLEVSNLTIQGFSIPYTATIPYVLESEDWRNEMIFANERDALLDVNVRVPILVRQDAYRMETLAFALTKDTTTDPVTDQSGNLLVDVDREVQVNADGTVGEYP
jgi:hypothetical protein